MNIHVRRELEKVRTAELEFELADVIVNHKDPSDVISKIKSIDLNVLRIGRFNKWKSLCNWVFDFDEKSLKIVHPDADFKAVKEKAEELCKRITRNEI